MARNKKVEILSNDKEVLHPMTDGDCVIFEDGQTLAQKLSEDDSVKYTPEIVNSSPMFKVGEGNTVDYSDNVLDGAYERATLQGQTYVNYIQESSADEITLPTPFTEYERTQHNTLTSNEEGTLGINLVGQSYVNALQHDSEEEYVVLGESLEFQEKKVEYTNEGQIKSAMLKGQTLVNLGQPQIGLHNNDYSYQGNASACVNYDEYIRYIPNGENNLCPCIRLHLKSEAYGNHFSTKQPLKTNTKYIVFVKLNVQSAAVSKLRVSTTGYNNVGEVGSVVLSQGLQVAKAIFTTPTEFTDHLCVGTDLFWQQSQYVDLYWYQLFEYQDGMENWDIPYFEGMQSVTVSTRLENLCHRHTTSSLAKTGKTFKSAGSINDRVIQLLNLQDGNASSIYGMKPNTKYLVQFKISNLVLDGLSSLAMQFSTSTIDNGNSVFVNGTVRNLINSNGVYRVVLTTSDILETSNIEIKGVAEQWENSGSSLRSMTISEIMYIEYQNGMENWNLPYFEDYQVMKPVQVESMNKNLCPVNKNDFYNIHFKAGTEFTLSTKDGVASQGGNIVFKDIDGNDMWMGIDAGTTSKKYTLSKDAYSIHNFLQSPDVISYQLEEGNTATEYVPHQSKTTYSWDEVILRKVGDVEDTLDLTTGEWVQRIGEVTLDGSETWVKHSTKTNVSFYYCYIDNLYGENWYLRNIINDKLQQVILGTSITSESWQDNKITEIGSYFQPGRNGIGLFKNVATVSELQQYLQQNPITVQYKLETPIVHKVNLSRPNLQVYDDITHVHTKCLDGTLIPNIYLPSDISYPAILEPGKKYNVCINHTQVNADNPLKVNVGGTEITMTDSRMTLTTPATLANSNVSFTGKGNKIKESMLIKNSSLLTRDLPHFNGIGSVQLGKTIENLCESGTTYVGTATITETQYNDKIVATITAKGSLVYPFQLTKQLENGKRYFVYVPNTFPTAYQGVVGFQTRYNGQLGFAYNSTADGVKKSCVITVNQNYNPYTKLTFGRHGGDLPINTTVEVQRPIICEYEPGMENWDWESIGYFTGTKNIGNEFMKVQNKNLFDGQLVDGYIDINNGSRLGWESHFSSKNFIRVYPSLSYKLPKPSIIANDQVYALFEYDKDKQYVGHVYLYDNTITYIPQENVNYIIISGAKNNQTLQALSNSIQIEESSTATTYTAHKHNGLYITKDQPIELTWEQGRINPSGIGDSYTNAINNAVSYGIRTKGLLNLKPNTTYRISLGDKVSFKYHIAVFDNWDNALPSVASLSLSGDWVSSVDTIFTTTKDAHKIGINVQKQDAGSITPPESVHAQIRLEEVTDVVLRSCSAKVYDELDLTRGTYTQNVGMVYLDGINSLSQQIAVVGDTYQPTDTTLKTFDIKCNGAVVDSVCLSNRFPMRESVTSTNINFESVRIHSTNQSCRLTIKKEKASTLEEFKLWLQDNPLEIIYPLSKSIVHKVHIGNKNEANTEVVKPNGVFTLPTLYTEQTHIDLTNNGIIPKVQSRDYIAYPVLPMIGRTYTLQHNLTGGVSNLTVDLLGRTQGITYQNHKSLVYTPESLVSNIKHKELRISGKGKISKVMYIDGGYMDRDIPYIEGMKNAVNPIVKNIGKNLYRKDNVYIFNDGEYIGTKDYYKKSTFKVKRNTNYVMTFEQTSNDARIYGFSDETFITYLGANTGGATRVTFNTGICNGISFYRQVKSGLTMDYKITLSEVGTDEPYKENICYVDCGEIRLTPDMFEQGSVTVHVNNIGKPYTVGLNNDKTRIRTKKPINIEPNEQYVIIGNTDKYGYSLHFLDKDENFIGVKAPYELSWGGHKPFTVASDSPKALVFVKRMDNGTITPNDVDVFNFQLVKVSEIKQLRSLPHGVHDEIDLETGKYIQRVGEITFNGTENWTVGYSSWDNKYTYYNYDFIDIKLMKGDNGSGQAYYDAVRCPQLHRSYMGRLASAKIDGVCSYYYSGYQRIFISKQDCATVNELKLWLKENPITVQYELPEPIVKDIVIHNYPHSYEGGHVIIENGDPNTPIPAQLTYRAVTNRSGQIQQHTEQVEKQEREINELETLILANIHLSQTR